MVVLVVTLSNAFLRLEGDEFKAKLTELRTAGISTGMPTHPSTEYYYLVDDPFRDVDFSSLQKRCRVGAAAGVYETMAMRSVPGAVATG